jgi:hypothetical protein
MALPKPPITLNYEQVEQLHRRLSSMRHDINNHLSLIVAAAELIRMNPDLVTKMATTLVEQPPRITEEMSKFSAEFERVMGVNRSP